MRALAAALLLLAAGCAALRSRSPAGWKESTVEAEGWSPLAGDDLLTARKRALVEAQRKAVEKAVGVTVKADTQVKDAVSLRQSISANAGGTIARYDVLSESEAQGFMKVRIRAVVLCRPPPERRPLRARRFFVKVAGTGVAEELRRELSAWDFPVVDAERDADVVVGVVVETSGVADSRLGGLYSYRAKVSLEVADVATGAVSRSAQEASAIDVDERAAFEAALQKAAALAGQELAARYAGEVQKTAAAW